MAGNQDTDHDGKEELRIIGSLVEDPDMTVEAAITQFRQLTLASTTYRERLKEHCNATAQALLDIVAITAPENHEKLLSFLRRLRRTTIIEPLLHESLRCNDKVVWTGLPTFETAFASALDSITGEDGTPEQKQRWENTIAFFAELDAGSQGREFDYTSRAKSYIHAALSGNLEPETREVRIRLACIWYAHDAAKLWDKMADRNADRVQWRDWAHCLRSKSEESFEDEGTRILIVRAFNQICHVSQE